MGIGYYTPEGKVIWYNKTASENFVGKHEDFEGKILHELFSEEAAERYLKRLKNAIETNERVSYEDKLQLACGNDCFIVLQ